MSNRIVQIEADKVRNLKFNYNALIMLQEEFGIDVDQLSEKMSLKDIRAFYYCGLKHEEPDLTVEKTGDILDAIIETKGMEYIGNKLAEAVMKAFGITEETLKKHQKKVANSKKK